jgi:hypothetical protein
MRETFDKHDWYVKGKGEISAFQSLRNGCVRKRTQPYASERKRTHAY